MGLSDKAVIGRGRNSPDPLVREAYLMAYDFINYVTAKPGVPVGPAPSRATAALRHAGDELLTRFPIFFHRWPCVFQDVTDRMACSTLASILDEHFAPTRHRELAWSAVLSVFITARKVACLMPQIQECVGSYVERVICPEIRDRGGWADFMSRFGEKQNLEDHVMRVSCWSLLLLSVGICSYLVWTRRKTETTAQSAEKM